MGTTGLAVTGGAFFNDWSSTDGDVALYNEGGPRAKISVLKKKIFTGASLDSCFGHSSGAGL